MSAKIAFCLFEDSVTDINLSNLIVGKPLTEVKLNVPDKSMVLFLKKAEDNTPDWVGIVQGFAKVKTTDTSTASSGAILFFNIQNRIIACCFGSSVGNINKSNIVKDFGLAVAFRKIPVDNLKGIETFTLAENPITNNRSAAIPASQNSFNLDSFLEIITELSGRIIGPNHRETVKGKEFFSAKSPDTLDGIRAMCEELIDDYTVTVNDKRYKNLTAVSKVKTPRLLDLLEQKICEALNKRATDLYVIDYQQNAAIDSYSLTPKGVKYTEIDINRLYASVKSDQKFAIPYLKTKNISIFDSNGQLIDTWPLYKCLFKQITLNKGSYILYKGIWYEIQDRYLQDLKTFISSYEVKASTLSLPAWDGVADENTYNRAAALSTNGQCWDRVLYNHTNFKYGIEFCDVLLPQYVIHVKKLSSSSLTSHLLMQTYVSAQLLNTDPGIRAWQIAQSKKIFHKSIFLNSNGKFKSPPIKYVIALMAGNTSKQASDQLPFFSLITLNMIIRRIILLGYEVQLCLV